MFRHLVAVVLIACGSGPAPGQAKLATVTVQAPTRLDWQFGARQFGAEQARAPADYDSGKQRYQLFVPKNYTKDKTWPLVLFVAPGADAGGWSVWHRVCEKQGVLFCAPYGAGNSCPPGRRCRIVLDALDDVRRQYNIDPNRTYISGFSGGARMACTIGFSLPEYFGGIVPIGGTNPLPKLTYLKHRIRDRLALAHVAGATDFNRKEHEDFMHPWWQGIGITSKLWIVPKTGHALPPPEVLLEVYQWLDSKLPQRQGDAANQPKLTVTPDEAPTAQQQAQRLLEVAGVALRQPGTTWRGVALLQGVVARWPQSESAKAAQVQLQQILQDEAKLKLVAEQGGAEERRFVLEQSRALERFGRRQQALQSWEFLAQQHPDSPEGELARQAVKRLRAPQ
jgi:hypothetical protein